MTLLNLLILFGLVLLLIGLIFIIPYKVVSRLKGETEGIIDDMTLNAGDYNANIMENDIKSNNNQEKGPFYVNTRVGNRPMPVDGPEANMYHAVYTYTVDGIEYRKADGLGYNKGNVKKKIGKKVRVYYDIENPEKASLSSGKCYKYISMGLSILGIIFLIVSLILYLL